MNSHNLNKDQAGEFCHKNAPIVILKEPQLGENVGMVARAMLNCGLSELRLVSPNPHMDMDKAKSTSVKAFHVMNNMKIFSTLDQASADINYIYATTARPRDQIKPVVSPEKMAEESLFKINHHMKVGYLFGKESVGLSNKDVAFANAIVTIPLNPAFSSLNLAQSVLLCAYEWNKIWNKFQIIPRNDPEDTVTKKEMESLYTDLFQRLEETSFLNKNKKSQQTENQIRNVFNKIPLSPKELRLLRGMFRFLQGKNNS